MTDNQTKKNKTSKKNSLSQVTIAFICTFISDEINELKTSLKAEKKPNYDEILDSITKTLTSEVKRQLTILNQRKIRSQESDTIFIKGNGNNKIKDEKSAVAIVDNALKTEVKDKKAIKILKCISLPYKGKKENHNPTYKITFPPGNYRVETNQNANEKPILKSLSQLVFQGLRKHKDNFTKFNISRQIPSYCRKHLTALNSWAFRLKTELYDKDATILRTKIYFDYNDCLLHLKYKIKGQDTWIILNKNEHNKNRKIPKHFLTEYDKLLDNINYYTEDENTPTSKKNDTNSKDNSEIDSSDSEYDQ